MRTTTLLLSLLALASSTGLAQPRSMSQEDLAALRARRDSIEKELQSVAIIDRKLMIPMRDGVRMQFDVYRPRNVQRAPAIFVRTPYNMNYWDVNLGAPADMTS